MVDIRKVSLALAEVNFIEFERFGQAFYASLEGASFVPLGGSGDGGADGLFIDSSNTRALQISTEVKFSAKIISTCERLKVTRPKISSLTYLTNRNIQNLDKYEDDLSESTGFRVRIRDGRYVESHSNHNQATQEAIESFLFPAVSYLKSMGSSNTVPSSDQLPAAELCTFVSQELENRRGNATLLESLSDSLILWALNDTDPETGKLKSRGEVLEIIVESLPAAKTFIGSGLIDQSQKMTVAARATAEKKAFGQRS